MKYVSFYTAVVTEFGTHADEVTTIEAQADDSDGAVTRAHERARSTSADARVFFTVYGRVPDGRSLAVADFLYRDDAREIADLLNAGLAAKGSS